MHKMALYPRLAAGNLWRNRTTYIPYLLACITSIITFYSLLAIQSSGSLDTLRGADVVRSFTAIGIVILAIFCVVLLFWTNSFLIKRRKRELALYSVLGMEKRNIALVMFFETLFIAVIALVLGLLGGVLIARLLYLALLNMIKYSVTITLPISVKALGATAVFFIMVFALTLVANLRQVRLASPVEMIAQSKSGEKEPKSSLLITVLGLVCVAAGYYIAITQKEPTGIILTFLGAVMLVIIGTYCLFASGSIALLKFLRKRKNYYYTPKHFISVSGMIYRMKQNAAGLATICILSCMVLVTVGTTVSLYTGMEHTLQKVFPNDYEFVTKNETELETAEKVAQDVANTEGIALEEVKIYESIYTGVKKDENIFTSKSYHYTEPDIMELRLIRQSEFEKNEGEKVSLSQNQALLLTDAHFPFDTFVLDEVAYNVRKEGNVRILHDSMPEKFFMLVLPDAEYNAVFERMKAGYAANEDEALEKTFHYSFTAAGTDEARANFEENLHPTLARVDENLQFSSRTEMAVFFYAMNGGFLFLGCFFGLLFLLAAVMIIYYKQLSEGYDDADRFDILQKVGMSSSEVKKTILSQVRSVFFLPLGVAVLHVMVAAIPVKRAIVLFGVTNIWLLLASFAVTILLYAVVYLLVYRRTASVYFNIVRKAQ